MSDPNVPTIDNPKLPDPIDLMLTGKGRWMDAQEEWKAEVLSARERKYGMTPIPEPEFEYDPESPWAPERREPNRQLQAQASETVKRWERGREERERAQRREAARQVLRNRGLLK